MVMDQRDAKAILASALKRGAYPIDNFLVDFSMASHERVILWSGRVDANQVKPIGGMNIHPATWHQGFGHVIAESVVIARHDTDFSCLKQRRKDCLKGAQLRKAASMRDIAGNDNVVDGIFQERVADHSRGLLVSIRQADVQIRQMGKGFRTHCKKAINASQQSWCRARE